MDGPASHHASVDDENESDRVEFKGRASEPCSHGQVLQDPALGDEVGHDGVETETCGNGRALKVLALAGCILGQDRDGDVEAGKTGEAAEDEEGEAGVVDSGAQTEREGHGSGSDAERDLGRVSFVLQSWFIGCVLPSRPGSRAPVPSCCSSSSTVRPCRP